MFPQTRQCKKHSLNSFLKLAKTKNALRHQSCNVNACGVRGIIDEKIRLNTKKDSKMSHKNHNYEKESEKFYDNIAHLK